MLTPELELAESRQNIIADKFINIIYGFRDQPITENLIFAIKQRLTAFLIDNRYNVFVDIGLRPHRGLFEIIRIKACFPEERGVDITVLL